MDTSDLSTRLAQLLTTTTRENAIQLFTQELMIALAKEDYRLDDLAKALAEYAKGRDDWQTVVYHLERAAAEVVRTRNNITQGRE